MPLEAIQPAKYVTQATIELPNLYGLNSALEVDLTGQVNAEAGGGRHFGLIGGQADFLRGCMRSAGGTRLIVLESTAKRGMLSRIPGCARRFALKPNH
ncbi:MAG: hypothetical protein GKR94_00705 [Gammaproteobacteria bacterium]|nr:hypothetical protein [Gammaproteobacteria bacterium]